MCVKSFVFQYVLQIKATPGTGFYLPKQLDGMHAGDACMISR